MPKAPQLPLKTNSPNLEGVKVTNKLIETSKPVDLRGKTPKEGGLQYETREKPRENGVYACRVPQHSALTIAWSRGEGANSGVVLCTDIFLSWINGDGWGYLGSDQKYRGKVVGWIGPLPRVHEREDDIPF